MIIFGECPNCGLKIGRASDYCPRCMKSFGEADSLGEDKKFIFLSRNLQRKEECKNLSARARETSHPMSGFTNRNYLRFRILLALVMALIIFITIKSSRSRLGLFSFIPQVIPR